MVTVHRESGSVEQSPSMLGQRILSKPSVKNPALMRVQRMDAYSLASSPPTAGSFSRDLTSPSLVHRRVVQSNSRRSFASVPAVRPSASYKRGVSFTHRRKQGVPSRLLRSGKQNDDSPLTLQERYLRDSSEDVVSTPQSSPISESPPASAVPIPQPRRSPAKAAISRQAKTTSHYWKEDARKVSSELEKACDEAFNRFSMNSSIMTIAATEPPGPSYDSPATSMGIHDDSHLLPEAPNKHGTRRTTVYDPNLDRPLPMPPSYEYFGSFTYRELAKTRALLKRRAAEMSLDMSPGCFDDVIAHLDRLMQPSTARINEENRRIVSSPKPNDSRRSGDEFEKLLAKGPFSLRSASEPVPGSRTQYRVSHPRESKDGIAVKIAEAPADPKPISPTKPLTIRKKSGSSTNSGEYDRRRRSKESLLVLENDQSYDYLQSGERRFAGLSLLERSLEPIVEDEDKENRDPRRLKTYLGDGRKKGWFRRHERAQPSQESDGAPPLPPKDEPLSPKHYYLKSKQVYGASQRVSSAPSDGSQTSNLKLGSGGKGKFFRIFGKRDSKDSSSKRGSGGEQDPVLPKTVDSAQVANVLKRADYDLDETASINSTTSSIANHAHMSGALHNARTTNVSRRRGERDKATMLQHSLLPSIQPQHQNWFARFLRIKPATSILCFQISKIRARKEIAGLFREWRKYGMRDVVVDKAAGRIWTRVAERNCEFAGRIASDVESPLAFCVLCSYL